MSDLLVQRPDFLAIDVETIEQQLDQRLADCRAIVEEAAAVASPDWD